MFNVKKFRKWLQRHGACLAEPKSGDELLRFSTTRGDGVIHCSGTGKLLPNDVAEKAMRAFRTRNSWTGGINAAAQQKRKRRTREERIAVIRQLAERDGGMRCAYCGALLNEEEATIEHVIPLSKNGVDSTDNMIIACRSCNLLCKNYGITQKLKKVQETMQKYGADPEELSRETEGYEDIAKAEERKKKAAAPAENKDGNTSKEDDNV